MAGETRGRRPKRPPAKTADAREKQMVALAMDLAEEQIRTGRASAQVVSHFLKLGTEREKLERVRLERENQLLEAKVEALASEARVEELYKNAIEAMRSYQPSGGLGED